MTEKSLHTTQTDPRSYKKHLENLVETRTKEILDANTLLRQEIRERKQAEQALIASEQRINAILQASPVGIGLVIDRELNWANATMYNLVGYPEDSLLGKNARLLYENDEEYERVGKRLIQCALKGEAEETVTRWVRQDGTLFDCSLRSYFLDREDPSQGLIVAVTDISKEKNLEKRLRQAQKMEALGTLAGGVAHDLNNILSSIVSYPELILLDLEETVDATTKNLLHRIKKSGEQAAAVVQDMLTMARRGVSVSEPVDINAIILEQCSGYSLNQLEINNPGVHFVLDLANEPLIINGAEPHLSKSLVNLLVNGAESISSDSGTVTVRTAQTTLTEPYDGFELVKPGKYVTLTIEDTGSGIPEENISQIFDPFYTTKEMGRSGSGLGMTVVWGTVKDHGGFFDIRSSANGTAFTLYFPLADNTVINTKPEESLDSLVGSGESVVVVDDSASQREICQQILSVLKYNTTCIASGAEAVEFLKAKSVDLVILDMIMPGLDGLDTFRQLYKINPDQKFIIASGFSENERVREIQKLSGCLYLKKPFTIAAIGQAIKATLHSPGRNTGNN